MFPKKEKGDSRVTFLVLKKKKRPWTAYFFPKKEQFATVCYYQIPKMCKSLDTVCALQLAA